MFEPISGTLGGVALLDPALRAILKSYSLYRLDKLFGEEFNAYRISHDCEIARLDSIGQTKVTCISGGVFDQSGTHLKETLRARMELMFTDLKICEGLMKKYGCPKVKDMMMDQRFNQESTIERIDRVDGVASSLPAPSNRGSQSLSLEVDQRGQIPSLSGDSTTVDTIRVETSTSRQTLSTRATSYTTEAQGTAGAGSTIPDPENSKEKGNLRWYSDLKRAFQVERNAARTTPKGKFRKLKAKLGATRDLPQVILSDKNEETITLRADQPTVHNGMLGEPQRMMNQRSIGSRVQWLVGDRQKFKDCVERMTKHNDFFQSMLNVNFLQIYRQCEGKRIDVDEAAPETVRGARVAFNHMQAILSNPENADFLYSLWLNGSSDEFKDAFKEETEPMFEIQESSSLFTVQVHQVSHPWELSKPITLHVEVMQPAFGEPEKRMSLQNVFNIHSAESAPAWNESYYHLAGQIFNPASNPCSLKLIHDLTPYSRANRLRDFIKETQQLGSFEHIRHRKLLAKLTALSILQVSDLAIRMEDLPSALRYYLVQGQDESPSSDARTSVYLDLIQRRNSAVAFRKHLGVASSRCRTLMYQLGTLLLEIGRWKLLASNSSYDVKLEENELLRSMGPYFLAAVQQCFRWDLPDSKLNIDAMWSRVICPIQKSLDNCLTET